MAPKKANVRKLGNDRGIKQPNRRIYTHKRDRAGLLQKISAASTWKPGMRVVIADAFFLRSVSPSLNKRSE